MKYQQNVMVIQKLIPILQKLIKVINIIEAAIYQINKYLNNLVIANKLILLLINKNRH